MNLILFHFWLQQFCIRHQDNNVISVAYVADLLHMDLDEVLTHTNMLKELLFIEYIGSGHESFRLTETGKLANIEDYTMAI